MLNQLGDPGINPICHWHTEIPMDSKEIKPVNPKVNQSWIFIGRTDAEAEAPILWPPDVKRRFTGKDSDAGKDWGQDEKRATEDEIGWMASLIQRTWVWANSGRQWRTGKPGVLQSMGLQSLLWLSDWTTTVWWLESNLLLFCKGIWYLYSRGTLLYQVLLLYLRILALGLCWLQKGTGHYSSTLFFEKSQHTWSPSTKIKYDKYIEHKMYHLKLLKY